MPLTDDMRIADTVLPTFIYRRCNIAGGKSAPLWREMDLARPQCSSRIQSFSQLIDAISHEAKDSDKAYSVLPYFLRKEEWRQGVLCLSLSTGSFCRVFGRVTKRTNTRTLLTVNGNGEGASVKDAVPVALPPDLPLTEPHIRSVSQNGVLVSPGD